MKFKLHALEGHQDAVTSISWHPFEEAVLASASNDRRIIFWDLSKVGEEQTPDDQEDGPPELYVVPPKSSCLFSLNSSLGTPFSYLQS